MTSANCPGRRTIEEDREVKEVIGHLRIMAAEINRDDAKVAVFLELDGFYHEKNHKKH